MEESWLSKDCEVPGPPQIVLVTAHGNENRSLGLTTVTTHGSEELALAGGAPGPGPGAASSGVRSVRTKIALMDIEPAPLTAQNKRAKSISVQISVFIISLKCSDELAW